MRNSELWKETKFVRHRGELRASRRAADLAPGSRLITDEIAKGFDEHIAKHVSGRLGDLGCGKVPLFGAYSAYATEVVCVDWPKSAHDNQFIDHLCDLCEPLPFADSYFDTIILSDVLEHIAEPQKLWFEIARILVPGGKFLWSVPFMYWLHEEPNDYYRYTEFALRRFAEQSGFEVVALDPIGGIVELIADASGKVLQAVPGVGGSLAGLVQTASSLAMRSHLGRLVHARTCAKFPLAYLGVARRNGG